MLCFIFNNNSSCVFLSVSSPHIFVDKYWILKNLVYILDLKEHLSSNRGIPFNAHASVLMISSRPYWKIPNWEYIAYLQQQMSRLFMEISANHVSMVCCFSNIFRYPKMYHVSGLLRFSGASRFSGISWRSSKNKVNMCLTILCIIISLQNEQTLHLHLHILVPNSSWWIS